MAEKVIYNIPCCGGFCAPTVSPEESCLKHVSNEYTLPASGVYLKASPVIESNVVCRTCGGIGLSAATSFRKPLMLGAAGVNALGCILCMFALVGLGSSYSALVFGHWIYGEIDLAGTSTLKMYFGVSSRVLAVDCDDVTLASFLNEGFSYEGDSICAMEQSDDSCTSPFDSAAIAAMCEDCKDNQYSESTLIMGVITYWPSLLTNFQRSTEFGDVNCQKFMGIVSTLIGMLTNIMALTGYADACYAALPTSADIDGSSVSAEWSLGGCFNCLIAATVFRLVDLFVHTIVPTPPSRHVPLRSDAKTLEDYMLGGSAGAQLDSA